MHADVVEQANYLLDFLSKRASKDWKAIVIDVLDEQLAASHIERVEKLLAEIGRPEPVGAIPASTAIAKEPGLEGEMAQRAVQALKESGRLVQAGRGRGKCLVVVSDEPLSTLPQQDATTAAETPDVIAADDVPNLLRAVRESYLQMAQQLDETTRTIHRLEATVNEQDQTIRRLEEEKQTLEHKQVASWQ